MDDQRVTRDGQTYVLHYTGQRTQPGWEYRLQAPGDGRQLAFVYRYFDAVWGGTGWVPRWYWQDAATGAKYTEAVELVGAVLAGVAA